MIDRQSLYAAGVVLAFAAACGGGTPTEQRPATPAPQTGQIRGIVRLHGAAPASRHEPNTKQPEVCGSQVPVTRLAVGASNGVGRAFVYLDGLRASGPLKRAASVTIGQKDCTYAPGSMVLATGTPIEIVNDDPVLHNVHASTTAEGRRQTVFNIAQPVRGQRTKVETELKPGIMTLTCEAGHPWMKAHVFVAEHDYVAVTDGEGRFVIDGVPAGTYPIKMWHEGVALKRIIASLQQFEYEEPYEVTKHVVVTSGGVAEVEFELALRE